MELLIIEGTLEANFCLTTIQLRIGKLSKQQELIKVEKSLLGLGGQMEEAKWSRLRHPQQQVGPRKLASLGLFTGQAHPIRPKDLSKSLLNSPLVYLVP